ncbi:MAG: energy transducer TonB [Pyrinomonadaceae bacterium]
MKTCPKCGTGYSDDLSFCLEDGTMLPAYPTTGPGRGPTEEYQTITNQSPAISSPNTPASPTNVPTPPSKQYKMSLFDPASRMGCIVTFGQVSAILLLVLGIGVAGLYVTYRGGSELAKSEPQPAYNTASTAPVNVSANAANSNASAGNYSTNTVTPMATPATTKKPSKTISGGVVNGKATSLPQPPYPPAARAVRASGVVSVQVLIDVDGRVLSASALSGHPLLRSAAVAAARSATFTPMILGGEYVKVSGVITYNFTP